MLHRRPSSYRRGCLGLAVAAALALAGPAAAATLASASFGFVLGGLPPTSFPASGATGSATSDLSASLGAGTAFHGTITTSIPTSAAPPLTNVVVKITKNAGGTFTGATPGQVGGAAAIYGEAQVNGLSTTLLSVPLAVGAPGTISQVSGGVAVTVVSGSWTSGAVTVTGVTTTTTGFGTLPNGTAMATGVNALTPGGSGTLVLVAPLKLISSLVGNRAGFGTLTLTYVPEPGTIALVGLGVAALGALAHRRR
jgi:hypothetical protein